MTPDRTRLLITLSLLGFVGGAVAAQDAPVPSLGEASANLVYTPVTPCRIIDTRLAGGPLTPGFPRSFFVTGTAGFETQGGLAGGCGVPTSATSAVINLVALDAAGPGNLRAFAYGQTAPLASVINFATIPSAIANGVAIPTCDHSAAACPFDVTIQANGSAANLVADVLGYFSTTGPVITGVTAGTGLSGGGSSGNVSVAVNSAVTQLRVGQTCAAGSSIRAVNQDGTVVCQADTSGIAGVIAGTGLSGGGASGTVTVAVDNAIVARKDSAAGNQTFDGGTLVLDYTNNRVGVGTPSPAQALDVAGNSRATDYLYTTPRTGYFYASGSSFVANPTGSPWGAGSLQGWLASGSQQWLSVPLNLPIGSTITNFSCYVMDNEPVNLTATAYIVKWNYGDGALISTPANMSMATSGVQSGITQVFSQALAAVFDNSAGGYFIWVNYTWSGAVTGGFGANSLYGCRVTYTMPRAGS